MRLSLSPAWPRSSYSRCISSRCAPVCCLTSGVLLVHSTTTHVKAQLSAGASRLGLGTEGAQLEGEHLEPYVFGHESEWQTHEFVDDVDRAWSAIAANRAREPPPPARLEHRMAWGPSGKLAAPTGNSSSHLSVVVVVVYGMHDKDNEGRLVSLCRSYLRPGSMLSTEMCHPRRRWYYCTIISTSYRQQHTPRSPTQFKVFRRESSCWPIGCCCCMLLPSFRTCFCVAVQLAVAGFDVQAMSKDPTPC